VTSYATIAGEFTFRIPYGFTTYQHVTTARLTAKQEIPEWRARHESLPMRFTCGFGFPLQIQLKTRPAEHHADRRDRLVLVPRGHEAETQLRVLFPVPIGGELCQAAETLFAIAQPFLCRSALRHVDQQQHDDS